MSYLIGESELNIINYNRLVKKSNSLSDKELIDKIKENYNLSEKTEKFYSPIISMRFLCIFQENGIL